MSLIQEALKRKDDENSGVPPKAIPVIAPEVRGLPVKRPAPAVERAPATATGKTPAGWPVLLFSLLVITVLALVAVGLLLYSARTMSQGGQQAKADSAAVESPAPTAAVSQPAVVKTEPVAQPAPQPVRAAPAPVPKPVAKAVPAPESPAPAPASVEPVVFSIPTGIVKEGVTEKKPSSAEVSVVPVSRQVVSQSTWPTLKVVGVMAPRSASQAGAAIIDGNLVECGDEIRGVKVQGVDKTGVWFEFKTQTQFVRVGQTTL